MSGPGALSRLVRSRAALGSLLCAVQAALAYPGLTGPTLWIDEAYCAVLARRSLSGIHAALETDSAPPLYYDLLHVWRGAFGESEVALRGLSLALTCAVTWMLLLGAGRFLATGAPSGRRAAAWAATLWAVSPSVLAYAQEVRNYALVVALGLGLTLGVLRYLESGGRRWLATIVLLGAAAAYTHNIAWVLMAALGLASLVRTRAPRRLAPLALAFAGVAVLYAPWAMVLSRQIAASDRFIGWVRPEWLTIGPLFTVASWIPGGARLPFVPRQIVLAIAIQAVNAAALLVAFGVACRRDRPQPASGDDDAPRPWATHVLVATIAVFIAIAYAMSLAWKPVLLAGRTDVVLLPLVACVAARGIAVARRGALVGGLMVAQMLVLASLGASLPQGADERPLATLLDARIAPGDVVICTGLTRPAVAYVTAERVPILSYPLESENRMGQFNPDDLESRLNMTAERARLLDALRASLGREGSAWLVSSVHPFHKPLHDALDRAPFLRLEHVDNPPDLGLRRYGEPLFVARYVRR